VPFVKGQSGHPGGRGSNKRRLRLLLKELKCPDDVDGLAVVATIASHAEIPLPMRLQAAIILVQYQRPKPTRKISKALELPVSETCEQATAAHLLLVVKIGLDEANDLIGFEKAFIEARTGTDVEVQLAELREVVAKLSASDSAVDITVSGGLPTLPGAQVKPPLQPEASTVLDLEPESDPGPDVA
jgi:hypothetical protein